MGTVASIHAVRSGLEDPIPASKWIGKLPAGEVRL